jgi:hypothetical protein
MPKKSTENLLTYTETELDNLIGHRKLKVTKITKEDKIAALELLFSSEEIRLYFKYCQEQFREGIVELSHPRYRGTKQNDVLMLHAKLEFITKLLDHAETLWKTRDSRRK